MHTNLIDRRKALTVVAAAPVALGAMSVAPGKPGELATLVRRYFAEIDSFNRISVGDERTDEDNEALADATFNKTMHEMVGVPARSRDDALSLRVANQRGG